MEKPDFDRVYDTFIRIGLPHEIHLRKLIDMIRLELYPLISRLKKSKIINWYFFLIHNRESGSIPTTKDDKNLYYHLKFGLKKNVNPEDFLSVLSVKSFMLYSWHWWIKAKVSSFHTACFQ